MGRISARENFLRALEFRKPEWIPCSVHFSPLTWKSQRKALEDIIFHHPLIFPDYKKGDKNFDELPPVYRVKQSVFEEFCFNFSE